MNNIKYLFALIVVASLSSCAQQGQLTGGPKDETPPKIDTIKSTASLQTRFEERSFTLTFDEYVTLNNPLKEVLISPPLAYPPVYKHRGKQVTFTFNPDEVLKSNATYTINFGKAIKDLNEGNEATNIRFIFSTGDQIDSGSLSGTVVDEKGQSIEQMLIMLYDDLSDSIPYLSKPFYATWTDKSGKWDFDYLREDTFKLFALKDGNANYLFDLPTEAIAYADKPIVIGDSLYKSSINLKAFVEDLPFRIKEIKYPHPGKVVILHEGVPKPPLPALSKESIIQRSKGDSLVLYFDTLDFNSSNYIWGVDTIALFGRTKSNTIPSLLARLDQDMGNKNTTVKVLSNIPISSFASDSIFTRDTAGLAFDNNTSLLEDGNLLLTIKTPDSLYLLNCIALPGALTDIYNRKNKDTISLTYQRIPVESTGSIEFNLTQLIIDSTNYILYFNGIGNPLRILSTKNLSLQDSVWLLPDILPGKYTIDILKDNNNNGYKDGGHYLKRSKAEVVQPNTLEPLKPNWTLKATLRWKPEEALSLPAKKLLNK